MLISGTGKQEAVSALVARIRAKARAKRASHLKFLRILGDGAVTGKARREKKESGKGSSSTGSPNKRMIGGDKAEAAGGHLVDALGVEAERKQSKSECMPTGSSCA